MNLHRFSLKNLRHNTKRLFRSKYRSTVSRSDPCSFSSCASSSSSAATPTSVLRAISGSAWSQVSGERDVHSELVQAFKLIDRDDDGVVSRREVAALLSRLSPEPSSQEDVSEGEGDECIGVEELARRVAGRAEGEEVREVFELFDADRDGRISAEELLRVFAVIGDEECTLEECRRMVASVDNNGDGIVCIEDFSRMMELEP